MYLLCILLYMYLMAAPREAQERPGTPSRGAVPFTPRSADGPIAAERGGEAGQALPPAPAAAPNPGGDRSGNYGITL